MEIKYLTTCSASPKWLWRNYVLASHPSLPPSLHLSLSLSLSHTHTHTHTPDKCARGLSDWVSECVCRADYKEESTDRERAAAPRNPRHNVANRAAVIAHERPVWPDRSELNYAQRRENFTWTREELFLTLRNGSYAWVFLIHHAACYLTLTYVWISKAMIKCVSGKMLFFLLSSLVLP